MFSPSEKIKLIGIGLFGSNENKTISSTVKILDGPSISSKVIYEENIEIAPGISKLYSISQIYFQSQFYVNKIKIIPYYYIQKH